MALGARKGNVVRLVMKQGMLLIGIGTTIGFGCAWAGSRMLSAMNSSVGQVTATNVSEPIVLFGAPVLPRICGTTGMQSACSQGDPNRFHSNRPVRVLYSY
jgi:ABC-type lipoprotein release transport system permease subunit